MLKDEPTTQGMIIRQPDEALVIEIVERVEARAGKDQTFLQDAMVALGRLKG